MVIPLLSWGLWRAYLWYDNWRFYAPQRAEYSNAIAEYAKYEAGQLALQARYAADFDGGATPQETWNLFVAALEEGDTDRASKYFVVERQDEMRKNFDIGLQSGAVKSFLEEDITLIEGETMYPDNKRFEYYTGSIDGGPGFVYILVKNPITGVWKIEDL